MTKQHLNPHEIPDDATGADVAAYIGEDIGRVVMLRVAALAGVVSVVAGLMSESAAPALRTACLAVGGTGLVLLLVAQLFSWRRSRQWAAIALVTAASGGLLAAVFLGSR